MLRSYIVELNKLGNNVHWNYQSFTPEGKVNERANLAKLSDKFPSTVSVVQRTGPTEIAIQGFAFGPAVIKVMAGQSITWTNADDTPHQVTLSGPKGKRSDVMLRGQSATMQFDEAGNIAYVCGLHPSMRGTIEVASR